MSTHKTKSFIWLIALGLVMACVVPSLSTPPPPLDPNAVNTFIAQTVIAASTQTSAAMPTSTPTPTATATPRNTDTPLPTPTNTVIFILRSPTPIVIPTFTSVGGGSGGGGSSSENYACQVVSVNPANGTGFSPRADFDAVWQVKNIGQKNWDGGSLDYIYLSGDQFHKVSGYDLNKAVKTGETVSIIVDMESPKNPGNYTTRWTLRAGAKEFCALSLTINVN